MFSPKRIFKIFIREKTLYYGWLYLKFNIVILPVIAKCEKNCGVNEECKNGTCMCRAGYEKKLDSGVCDVLPHICDENPCQNGGTCVRIESVYGCNCTRWYSGQNCSNSVWCNEGLGKKICEGATCFFDHEKKVGLCTCDKGQYFNYAKETCEVVDRCPLMQCKTLYQTCRNSTCTCKENFIENDDEICTPFFCQKPNICNANEVCTENDKNPGQVTCTCMEGYYFNGVECMKESICGNPWILNCSQRCNPQTRKCSCEDGFHLKADNVTCERIDSSIACDLQCKHGSCIKGKDGSELCVCPATHVSLNNTCVDKCTARKLPYRLCPDNKCVPDETVGYRCNCTGKYEYSVQGVTCERKSVCSELRKPYECAQKNALCVDDFKEKDGYRCKCRDGEDKDDNNICRGKCELAKYQKPCFKKLALCYVSSNFKTGCKCPPALTWGTEQKCNKLAEYSYTSWLLFPQKNYILSSRSRRSVSRVFKNSTQLMQSKRIDISKIQTHLEESVNNIYGGKTMVDILQCKDTNTGVNCSFEMQFQADPKEKLNVILAPQTCISDPGSKGLCIIPPNLVLQDDERPRTFAHTNPCTEEVKRKLCGIETKCEMVKNDNSNFVCSCDEGFVSYGSYTPLENPRTIIHRCKDIDECELGIHNCTKSAAICINTFGSFECICQNGFRKRTDRISAKIYGCVSVCDLTTCVHGHCELIGDHVSACRCHTGYYGLKCEEKLPTSKFKEPNTKAIVIGVVLSLALLIAISVFILKYKRLKTKMGNVGEARFSEMSESRPRRLTTSPQRNVLGERFQQQRQSGSTEL